MNLASIRMYVAKHTLCILAIVLALAAVMLLPFLPGGYDGSAQPLSVAAQMIGIFGLLLVPVGGLWLAYEVRQQRRRARGLPHTDKGSRFAAAAIVAGSVVVALLALAAIAGDLLSFGVLGLGLWLHWLCRRIAAVRRARAEPARFNVAGLYLVVVPVAVLLLQLVLAAPAAELSRNRAMGASAPMIEAIESYRAAHGHYPESMLGLHEDFHPSVMGIERYRYARRGAAYNLAFEQPLFVLDDIGSRELVVYNPRDEHVIVSHAVWNVLWPPEVSATRQGWFSSRDAGMPHWRCFRFD